MRLLFLVVSVFSVAFLYGTPGSDKLQELCQAVDNGNREEAYSLAAQLIEQEIDVTRSLNSSGETLLHRAAQQAMPRLVSLLLENGAQVDTEIVIKDGPMARDKCVKKIIKRHLPIHRAAVSPHIRVRGNTSEELYKRGAYPIGYIEKTVFITGGLEEKTVYETGVLHGYEHTFARVKVVHGWLARELDALDSDGRRGTEELIRSFDISPKREGKLFYWSTVDLFTCYKRVHEVLDAGLDGASALEEVTRSLIWGDGEVDKKSYWGVIAEHEQNKKLIREDHG